MNVRNVVSWLFSLAMIGAGLALVTLFFAGQLSLLSNAGRGDEPDLGGTRPIISGREGAAEKEPAGERGEADAAPEDKTLKLENGDEIYVTDSEGKRYTYRGFEEYVVQPDDVYVTESIEGKNVLTLQTCTLPNYTERLVTRAELVDA